MSTSQIIQISLELWGAVFCLICAIFTLAGEKTNRIRCRLLSAFMFIEAAQLVCDALAYGFRGNPTTLGWYMVRISNMYVFLSNHLLVIIGVYYLSHLLKENKASLNNWFKGILLALSGICILLILINTFTGIVYYFDESNFYHRNSLFTLLSAIAGLMPILMIVILLIYRRKLRVIEFVPFMIFVILPFVANIIQMFNYGISFANISLVIGLIAMFFGYEIERSRKLVEDQTALVENKTQLMLSQIRPHFIFNALGTIEFLYDEDPTKAKATMRHFTKYLRINMANLNSMELVSFDKEFEYTSEYLAIEKVRFEDILNVETHIQVTDFKLPSLTLQPIVENAVRHGIRGKEEGGTVHIYTERIGNDVVITVSDDGAGFDMQEIINDQKVHIGLKNVDERLQLMCNGKLVITSQPGKGTIAKIILPQK